MNEFKDEIETTYYSIKEIELYCLLREHGIEMVRAEEVLNSFSAEGKGTIKHFVEFYL